jgi:hypothetical protein
VLTAGVFGLAASSALIIGAVVGVGWSPPRRVTGVLLAFASGALISALAFELFEEAFTLGGPVRSGLGLLAGAAAWRHAIVAPNPADSPRSQSMRRTAGDVARYCDVYSDPTGPPNFARFTFLDNAARRFYPDWDPAGSRTRACTGHWMPSRPARARPDQTDGEAPPAGSLTEGAAASST